MQAPRARPGRFRVLRLGGVAAAVLVGGLWFAMFALDGLRLGAATPPASRSGVAQTVIADPALLVGTVEVAREDPASPVLLASPSAGPVLVTGGAAAALRRLEGRVVAVTGRLVESRGGPPTVLVREFRVLGERGPGRGALGPRPARPPTTHRFVESLGRSPRRGRLPSLHSANRVIGVTEPADGTTHAFPLGRIASASEA